MIVLLLVVFSIFRDLFICTPAVLGFPHRPACDNITCAVIYDPVCGSDGMTYFNPCTLSSVSCKVQTASFALTQVHKGDCKKPKSCNFGCFKIHDPVCGSDGKTYDNTCMLNLINCERGPNQTVLTHVHNGECQEKEQCPVGCNSDIYDPVCGSDGITYFTPCILSRANCERNSRYPAITKVHKGECRTTERCPQGCNDLKDPVCDHMGKTYGNPCKLSRTKCKRDSNDVEITSYIHRGECRKNCIKFCYKVLEPVCGSDGLTYSNPCVLSNANCTRGLNYPVITQVHTGECIQLVSCSMPCIQTFIPVCGTDDTTYNSLCEMLRANCDKDPHKPTISKAHYGKC